MRYPSDHLILSGLYFCVTTVLEFLINFEVHFLAGYDRFSADYHHLEVYIISVVILPSEKVIASPQWPWHLVHSAKSMPPALSS